MQTKKKQITAFALLLLVVLPLFFSAGLFLKQQIIQQQRRQRLDTELLQTITVSAEKIVWVKPGKEILVDGKLFDVKSFKKNGNDILLTGFYDYKEDKLVKHIRDIFDKKDDSNNQANQLAVKFLFYPKYKELSSFSLQNSWQITTLRFPVYTEVLFHHSYPVPAPPPKYC